MMAPWSMTMIRSLSASASSRYWVVNNVAMPAALEARRPDPRCFACSSDRARWWARPETPPRAGPPTAADVYPPPHPARIGADPPVRGIDQVELADEFRRPRAGSRLAQSLQPTEHHQILVTGEHVVDSHLLTGEHDRSADAGRVVDDVMTRHHGPASVRPGQCRQDVHRSGLARPVRPEQADDLAPADLERDVAHGVERHRTTC